jgi:hypothetical protein
MGGHSDIPAVLAHHEATIHGLSTRMGHVESGIKTMQHDMSAGFRDLSNKLVANEARPQFDFHKTVGTVVALAVLFSMVCAGIIYIVNGQNATSSAEQKHLAGRVDKHEQIIERLTAIAGWTARVETRK